MNEHEIIPENRERGRMVKKLQREYRRMKSNKVFQSNLLDVITRSLIQRSEKPIEVEEISLKSFDNKKKRITGLEVVLIEYSHKLSQIIYEGDHPVYHMPPWMITTKDKPREKELYLGHWSIKGEMCGIGQIITKSGNYFQGSFNKNLFHGKGLYVNYIGDSYFGYWNNGHWSGKGKLIILNQLEYEGDFESNMKHGKGIEIYNDNSKYIGDFHSNKKEGKGKYISADGHTYEGTFLNNMYHGTGEYSWPDGRKYKGEFKDGMLHGKAEHQWSDGSVFKGNYEKNKKQGPGVFFWPNGNHFTGYWFNNEIKGNGIFKTWNNKYEVVYRYGKMISSKVIQDNEGGENHNLEILIPRTVRAEHWRNALDEIRRPKKGNKKHRIKKESIVNIEAVKDLHYFICTLCDSVLIEPHKCTKCKTRKCLECVLTEGNTFIPCNNIINANEVCNNKLYEKDNEIIESMKINIWIQNSESSKTISYEEAVKLCSNKL